MEKALTYRIGNQFVISLENGGWWYSKWLEGYRFGEIHFKNGILYLHSYEGYNNRPDIEIPMDLKKIPEWKITRYFFDEISNKMYFVKTLKTAENPENAEKEMMAHNKKKFEKQIENEVPF